MVSFKKSIMFCILLVFALTLGSGIDTKASEANVQYTSVDSTVQSLKKQVELLESALSPNTPREAVLIWVKGVKTRNGALQFAVLSPELREKLRPQFEEMNWITGVSSPWVETYKISKENKLDDNTYLFDVEFKMATSTGDAGTDAGKVTVKKYGDYWFISDLSR